MRLMSLLLAIALMGSALLSGCVIVPLGGWRGHGHGRGGHYYHSAPYPYRGR